MRQLGVEGAQFSWHSGGARGSTAQERGDRRLGEACAAGARAALKRSAWRRRLWPARRTAGQAIDGHVPAIGARPGARSAGSASGRGLFFPLFGAALGIARSRHLGGIAGAGRACRGSCLWRGGSTALASAGHHGLFFF